MEELEKTLIENLETIIEKDEILPNNKVYLENIIKVFQNKLNKNNPMISLYLFQSIISGLKIDGLATGYLYMTILLNNINVIENKDVKLLDRMDIAFFCLDNEIPDEWVDKIFTALDSNENNEVVSKVLDLYFQTMIEKCNLLKLAYDNLDSQNIEIILDYFRFFDIKENIIEDIRLYLSTLIEVKNEDNIGFSYASWINLTCDNLNDLLKALDTQDWALWNSRIMKFKGEYLDSLSSMIDMDLTKRKEFWDKLITFNFQFINTRPYSCTSFDLMNISDTPRTKAKILSKIVKYKNNTEVSDLIKSEEELRCFLQKEYTLIASWYDNLSEDGIKAIVESMKRQGLTSEIDIKLIEEMLKDKLEKKKEKQEARLRLKAQKPKVEIHPIKFESNKENENVHTYTKKELMQMKKDLEDLAVVLRVEEDRKVTIDEYMKMLDKMYILEMEKYEIDFYLQDLFKKLVVDRNTRDFLYKKALYYENSIFEIYPILNEIKALNEEIKISDNEDREIFESMLDENYEKLYNLVSLKFGYEHSLYQKGLRLK